MSSTGTGAVLVDVWPDAGERLGIKRTKTWELVRSGELETVRVGRRRLVPVDALSQYVDRLRSA
jgi:excisionase family DNA binding protein